MNKKLYYHKTDGGAEYLCTSPIEGTDEGDLRTTIIRLDGEPELLNFTYAAAPELLEALENTLIILDRRPDREDIRRQQEYIMTVIAKARG